MTQTSFSADELRALADIACDSRLTEDDVARLEQLLCRNAEAQQFYLAHVCVDNWLRRQFAHPVQDFVSSRPSPAVSLLHGALGYFSEGMPLAYLLATVIVGIGLLIGSRIYVSGPEQVVRQSVSLPSPLHPLASVVGRITGMVDCKWESSIHPSSFIPHPSSPVALGDRFALASGLMEITYDSGAKVILQGPCTYEVESRTTGFLSLGKLTARVEKNEERRTKNEELSASRSSFLIPHSYFAVRTPTATVTDLGTEFGVEVSSNGACEVHVIEGLVATARALPDGGQAEENLLSANQAVRWEPNRSESAVIAADIGRFTSMRKKLVGTPPLRWPILDKTLVAWVSLDSLEQQGVGVLSVVNMPDWDGIVFGELDPCKWMAGSDGYARTQKDQSQYPSETAGPGQWVQIAVVYGAPNVTIYRNGQKYAEYPVLNQITFDSLSSLLFGKRLLYTGAYPVPTLAGQIEEVRFYNRTLSPEMIASLKPNEPSSMSPVGWWTFEDGTARDVTDHFPMGELHGNAQIANGKLILDGHDSYLFVPPAKHTAPPRGGKSFMKPAIEGASPAPLTGTEGQD